MAQTPTKHRPPSPKELREKAGRLRETQLFRAIFRPGSIFRKGYQDSPRNRAYVVMNSVLYHLHPVKVKRHGIKLSYTLCLGGLSFFLFIFLTITGIFLMFFYRPATTVVYSDMVNLHTTVAFGQLVRNLHRWGAHLMVITVFLHMGRVFYTGAYKPPREFNWVIGVVLLLITLLLAFTGYLLPWDQLSVWAVTVGTQMINNSPVVGKEASFVLLGGQTIGAPTLVRWYTLHVLALPFVIVVVMAVHFWRVRKDGGISGPL
jgi:quinol-cytochrome oxidoreductase complex cytochrome b subunit